MRSWVAPKGANSNTGAVHRHARAKKPDEMTIDIQFNATQKVGICNSAGRSPPAKTDKIS